VAAAIVTVALIAYLFYLWTTGFEIAEHWLLLILPPFFAIVIYVLRTGDTRSLEEPLSARRIAWKYLMEEGWWVAMWLVLIFGFGYFFG
jgi:hypothetical protein